MTTILLVEDTKELANLVQTELAANGYQIVTAGDGESALACFESAHPDLIILDWMLPRMDGLEVLRRIRQKSAIPILMLTARREETDRVIGLEVGADDYLTKPFGMRELVARIHAMLRRSELIQSVLTSDRNNQNSVFTCGALQLDPVSFTARLDGNLLELTRTEFNLLSLLARNPGRTFSRNYLLETVWGESYISGDRSVDNAILRLRRKLETVGDSIETVWGIGYRFNHP
ncbi:response regulator transcription factor [Leptolinea tardivitalis]|uniref:Transcriptional regulator n=1 Tax=Leptolinea tardivitalis TaxID=229920 RepID=A0A0N8GLR8_9CHLR|nr:response regulator transcription factor [Leptolinea tardivitalis]KPL73258.1 transcriptional regulator [Leptolinea tardivitalis]